MTMGSSMRLASIVGVIGLAAGIATGALRPPPKPPAATVAAAPAPAPVSAPTPVAPQPAAEGGSAADIQARFAAAPRAPVDTRADPPAPRISPGNTTVLWTPLPQRVDDSFAVPRIESAVPEPPPPPPAAPPRVLGAAATRGSSVDDATAAQQTLTFTLAEITGPAGFTANGKTVRFAEVAALDVDATCTDATGVWPCGRRALAAVRDLIRRRPVYCLEVATEADTLVARCRVGRTDISAWLVEQGWAKPLGSDARLTALANEARANRAGQFRGETAQTVTAGSSP